MENPNSLSQQFPELAKEFSSQNSELFDSFCKSSKKKVLWQCGECGHEWSTQIRKRTYDKSGCPVCARRKGKIPISVEFPHLVLDFDIDKNQQPIDAFTKGTDAEVHWKCHACGNQWVTPMNRRTTRGYGCKLCTTRKEMERRNTEKIAVKGTFADNHPLMAKEWDYSLNDGKPSDYLSNSGAIIHWRCSNGHSWSCSINERTKRNTNCAKCSHHFSQYEVRLVSEFEALGFEVLWNDKHFGREIDVYLPELKVGIEVDGYPWHDSEESRKRDQNKTDFFMAKGITIIRFRDDKLKNLTEYDVTYKHDGDLFSPFKNLVTKMIDAVEDVGLQESLRKYQDTSVTFLGESKFQEMMKRVGTVIKSRSLRDIFPKIAEEFSSKNHPLVAENVSAHAKKKVWWTCSKCQCEWKTAVGQRTRTDGKASGCPSCNSTLVVTDANNLVAKIGNSIKSHWDYDLNQSKPEEYRPYSKEVVWWKCPAGHSFEKQIALIGDKRTKKIKCTICSKTFKK